MNGYYGIFVLRAVIAILLVGLGGGLGLQAARFMRGKGEIGEDR